MKENEIGIACLWWGNKYDFEYVRRLYRAVKHLNQPFYCISDHPPFHSPGLDIHWVATPNPWWGWWQKINLFRRDFLPSRYTVFLDLDTVVLKNLAPLIEQARSYDWTCAPDLLDPLSSSLMVIDTYSSLAAEIFGEFRPERWVRPEDGDQDYLRLFTGRPGAKVWILPAAFHFSYKFLIDEADWRKRSRHPDYGLRSLDEISTLNFHGYPKPRDLENAPERWPYASKIIQSWSCP
jgi:hypothetical protein